MSEMGPMHGEASGEISGEVSPVYNLETIRALGEAGAGEAARGPEQLAESQPTEIAPPSPGADETAGGEAAGAERTRLQWQPGQAAHAIRAAAEHGVDVSAILPKGMRAILARAALPYILEGKTTNEIAETLGVGVSTITRTEQMVAEHIRDSFESGGYPDDLTPEMYKPRLITLREKPTGHVMSGLRETLAAQGMKPATIAAELGVHWQTITRALGGITRPTPLLAQALIIRAYPDDPEQAEVLYRQYMEEYRNKIDTAAQKRNHTQGK